MPLGGRRGASWGQWGSSVGAYWRLLAASRGALQLLGGPHGGRAAPPAESTILVRGVEKLKNDPPPPKVMRVVAQNSWPEQSCQGPRAQNSYTIEKCIQFFVPPLPRTALCVVRMRRGSSSDAGGGLC